jgi:hypothetical protein
MIKSLVLVSEPGASSIPRCTRAEEFSEKTNVEKLISGISGAWDVRMSEAPMLLVSASPGDR